MKTKIIRHNLKTSSKAAARPRAFHMLRLCGMATALWAIPTTANAQPPELGNYPDTTVQLGANTVVTPDATPSNTLSFNVSTANFKGLLEGNPANPVDGVVRVTNAHPAGVYTVTVAGLDTASGIPTTKTFTLTVTTPATCSPVSFAKTSLVTGTTPRSVAVGDFNRDGKQDLVVANKLSQNMSIFLGKGTGKFGPIREFSTEGPAHSVAVGDYNGDGKQDVVTASSFYATLLPGDGMGGFGAPSFRISNEARAVVVGEFDGDNKQDFAVANLVSTNVSFYKGNGFGSFILTNFSVPISSPIAIAVGNFNGNIMQDFAVAGSSPMVALLLSDGGFGFPSFTFPVPVAPVGTDPSFVAVGDLNGDGSQDLVTANAGSNNMSVLRGDGAGNFLGAIPFPAGTSPQSVAVGDFNGDGKQDLTIANGGSNNVWVLSNTTPAGGNLSFNAVIKSSAGTAPSAVAVGDFNGDGLQDLAVTNAGSNTVSIFMRQCLCLQTFAEGFDGFASPTTLLPAGWRATNMAGPLPLWAISTITPQTGPKDVFVDEPAVVSDKYLDSTDIFISSNSAQVNFHHSYNLENTYDGGVLEVSVPGINNGNFTDIIDPAVGGSFVPGAGGYNAPI